MARKTQSTNGHWNFLIAAGILAHTPDSMLLNGQALPRFQYGLRLVKDLDTFEDFCDLLKSRMARFEERYPEFPIETFVQSIFDENTTVTPEEQEDIHTVVRKCSDEWSAAIRKLYRSAAFMDKARQDFPDLYNELLSCAGSDRQFVQQTLKSI